MTKNHKQRQAANNQFTLESIGTGFNNSVMSLLQPFRMNWANPARRQRSRYRSSSVATTNFALLCLLLLFAPLKVVLSREADDRSRLIYADDPNASIILEYQLHNAPSADYSGDERKEAAKKSPGSEYDEEKHIKPYFLTPENGPRVVEYYSPWCG